MATKITKSELKKYIKEVLHEELTEARKKNPAPPVKLDIIRIESRVEKDIYGDRNKWRHIDTIIYKDPISGAEDSACVYEGKPNFGRWFGWGNRHSGHWNYAAYNYEGELIPGLDPSASIPATEKKMWSDIVNKINNPSDYEEE
jgi:hypothetical protein